MCMECDLITVSLVNLTVLGQNYLDFGLDFEVKNICEILL